MATIAAIAFRLFINYLTSPDGQNTVTKYGRKLIRAAGKSFLKAVKNGRVSREHEKVR